MNKAEFQDRIHSAKAHLHYASEAFKTIIAGHVQLGRMLLDTPEIAVALELSSNRVACNEGAALAWSDFEDWTEQQWDGLEGKYTTALATWPLMVHSDPRKRHRAYRVLSKLGHISLVAFCAWQEYHS